MSALYRSRSVWMVGLVLFVAALLPHCGEIDPRELRPASEDGGGGAASIEPGAPGAAGTIRLGAATAHTGGRPDVSGRAGANEAGGVYDSARAGAEPCATCGGNAGALGTDAGGHTGSPGSAGSPTAGDAAGGALAQAGGAPGGSGGRAGSANGGTGDGIAGRAAGGRGGTGGSAATCLSSCPVGSRCENGSCVCASGTTLCAGECVNTTTDPGNCGGCGQLCGTPRSCQAGRCACPSGQSYCAPACVELDEDAANCGACGSACSAPRACANGRCEVCATGCAVLTSAFTARGYARYTIALSPAVDLRGTALRARAYSASTYQASTLRIFFDDTRLESGQSYSAPGNGIPSGWFEHTFEISTTFPSPDAASANIIGIILNQSNDTPGSHVLYLDSITLLRSNTPSQVWEFNAATNLPIRYDAESSMSGSVSFLGPGN